MFIIAIQKVTVVKMVSFILSIFTMNKEMSNFFSPLFWAVLGMETTAFCLLGDALPLSYLSQALLVFICRQDFKLPSQVWNTHPPASAS